MTNKAEPRQWKDNLSIHFRPVRDRAGEQDEVGPEWHKTAHGMCPQTYFACWMPLNAPWTRAVPSWWTTAAAGQRFGSGDEAMQRSAPSEDVCVNWGQKPLINVSDEHFVMMMMWRLSETFSKVCFYFSVPSAEVRLWDIFVLLFYHYYYFHNTSSLLPD